MGQSRFCRLGYRIGGRDAPSVPDQIFAGSVSPFFTSRFRVHLATRLKTTVLRSVGTSSGAVGNRRQSVSQVCFAPANEQRFCAGCVHCFISSFRGSMARGINPSRCASTSSCTIDVLFQT